MKQTQQQSCTHHDRTINKSTKTEKQNKKQKNYATHPYPTHPNPSIIEPTPNLPIPPIICSDNTMIMISQAEIRQSNGYGTVRNDDIFNLHLGSGAGH